MGIRKTEEETIKKTQKETEYTKKERRFREKMKKNVRMTEGINKINDRNRRETGNSG